jgi:hypothetical protein
VPKSKTPLKKKGHLPFVPSFRLPEINTNAYPSGGARSNFYLPTEILPNHGTSILQDSNRDNTLSKTNQDVKTFDLSLLKMINYGSRKNHYKMPAKSDRGPINGQPNTTLGPKQTPRMVVENKDLLKQIMQYTIPAANFQTDTQYPKKIPDSGKIQAENENSQIPIPDPKKNGDNLTYSSLYNIIPDIVDGLPITMPHYQLYPSSLRSDNYSHIKKLIGEKFKNSDWIKNESFCRQIAFSISEILAGAILPQNKFLSKADTDSTALWESFFESGNANNFELLIILFLLKIEKYSA